MKKISVFVFAIMLLTACKKDNQEAKSPNAMTPAGLTSKPNAESAKSTRPMKIDFYTTVNAASPPLSCALPGVPFGIANSGYFLHGTATHFGLIDPETSMGGDSYCNLSASTFILSTVTAGQIVALDGDKITYTGNDQIDLNNVIFNGGTTAAITGLWTITGGTGRFEGASGSFTISGIVNVASPGGPTLSFTGEGTITY
jgi:hypothetical protein